MSVEEKLPITKDILNERIGSLIGEYALLKTKVMEHESVLKKLIKKR